MKTHEAARTVAARVKTITDSLTEFATWISDKSFIRKLKLARQSGKRDSNELLALKAKHIAFSKAKFLLPLDNDIL